MLSELPKGTPFRQVRARASLLLSTADKEIMNTALAELINTRPQETLQALANAHELHEAWEARVASSRKA